MERKFLSTRSNKRAPVACWNRIFRKHSLLSSKVWKIQIPWRGTKLLETNTEKKISHALDRFVPPIQSPANITEPATSPAPATNSITPHSSGFHMETPMSRSFLAFYPLVRSATRLTAALHSALGRPRNKTKQQQQHQQKWNVVVLSIPPMRAPKRTKLKSVSK